MDKIEGNWLNLFWDLASQKLGVNFGLPQELKEKSFKGDNKGDYKRGTTRGTTMGTLRGT